MVRNHQGNKQPIEPSLVNQTTSKADYTTTPQEALMAKLVRHLTSNEEIVGSNPAESISFFAVIFLILYCLSSDKILSHFTLRD